MIELIVAALPGRRNSTRTGSRVRALLCQGTRVTTSGRMRFSGTSCCGEAPGKEADCETGLWLICRLGWFFLSALALLRVAAGWLADAKDRFHTPAFAQALP